MPEADLIAGEILHYRFGSKNHDGFGFVSLTHEKPIDYGVVENIFKPPGIDLNQPTMYAPINEFMSFVDARIPDIDKINYA